MKISMKMNHDQMKSFSTEVHGTAKPFISGEVFDLNNDTRIRLRDVTEHRAMDFPSVLNFVVEASAAMEVGLITTWLYDKCKASGIDEIDIEEEKVKIVTTASIEKALGEELRKSEKNT